MPKIASKAWSRNPEERALRKKAVPALKRLHREKSRLFLDRGRYGRLLQKLTGQTDAGRAVSNLRETSLVGSIVEYTLRVVAGKPHIKQKRREIVETLKVLSRTRTKKFRTLIFGTVRFLYDNHVNRDTAIHDPLVERAVYDVFADLAKANSNYRRKHEVTADPLTVGKQYFRELIRGSMVMNFDFVKHNYSPEKMAALKYGLVGERVDELTEQHDIERLKFVSSIFGAHGEIPEIDRFMGKSRERNRVLQAMIGIQFKAQRHIEDVGERTKFFNRVCRYYNIGPREVFEYARNLYYGAAVQGRRGQFLNDRELVLQDTIRKAQQVYGFTPAQKKAVKKREQERKPKLILSPGARFQMEVGKRAKE